MTAGRCRRAWGVIALSVALSACAATPVSLPWSSLHRHSLLQQRFRHVVRQQNDYSCGAASLATLMSFHYADPTSELDVLELLDRVLASEEESDRQLTGYSLLDLKRVAALKGYDAAGYRLTLEQLESLSTPVIVHVEPFGFRHFAVVRFVTHDRVVYLADPARGNLRMSAARFEQEWDGIVFALGSRESRDVRSRLLTLDRNHDLTVDPRRVYRHLDRPHAGDARPRRSLYPEFPAL